MTIATHFIETIDGAWIKGVPCLIPNLQEGQFVITMDGKEKDYRRWRWRIDKIETTIGSDVDIVLQEVNMTSCGPEDLWQQLEQQHGFPLKLKDKRQGGQDIKEALDTIAELDIELVEQYSAQDYDRWRRAVQTLQRFLQPILTDHKPNE